MKITVEVSPDDLRVMRKLVEIKDVHKFIKFTPTINVHAADNQKHCDIDAIIERIAKRMDLELNASSLTNREKAFLFATDSTQRGERT